MKSLVGLLGKSLVALCRVSLILLASAFVFPSSAGAQAPKWAWTGGSNIPEQPGVYGTEYQLAPSNVPGAREAGATWTDLQGKLWLFGGQGYDSAGNPGSLNDLWVFAPSQGAHGEWAWVGGSDTVNASGVYGTEFKFAASNAPGARDSSVTWTDREGRFWLFGGYGLDSSGSGGPLNDLWVFDRCKGEHGEWAWMGGTNTLDQLGVYGTEHRFAASNAPGARWGAVSWTDENGRLWLFGGAGYGSSGNEDSLNDLWVFDPFAGVHGEWAWMGGSDTGEAEGAYGTEYQFAASNAPGANWGAVGSTSPNGKLRLFGGYGLDSRGNLGDLDDLWVFDPTQGTNGEWEWIGGVDVNPSEAGDPGTYGTEGQFAASNDPGSRQSATTWTDRSGRLWLFGGFISIEPFEGFNDLWVFNPSEGANGEWAWMGGSETLDQPAVYGTEYQFAASNVPGARWLAAGWTAPNGTLWLFGGLGNDSFGNPVASNDLWELQVPSAGPSIIPAVESRKAVVSRKLGIIAATYGN